MKEYSRETEGRLNQNTWRRRICQFDEALQDLEGGIRLGTRKIDPLEIMLAGAFCLQMLIPISDILGDFYVILCTQVVCLLSDVWLYIQWSLAHIAEDQKRISWKQYLQYVPMDWREYRKHRFEIMFRHIGKLYIAAQLCQVLSQLVVGTLLQEGYQWQSFVYITILFLVCAVLPGIYQVKRYA